MYFELLIQIGVGKAAGAPVFVATMSPGGGSNPERISPRHVPYSKLLCRQAAFWIGVMYVQVS